MPAHMRPNAKPAKGTAKKQRKARKSASDRELATNAQKARERDQDCCRLCGYSLNVQVHHVRFRSQGIDHSTGNLVCLCLVCHARVHDRRIWLSGDADKQLIVSERKTA
jgi:5-methylcytosine-specific restriction endonuclease McrA